MSLCLFCLKSGKYDLGKDLGIKSVELFEIAKYPVTNKWYKEFMEAGGYKDDRYWSKEGLKWLENGKYIQPRYWDERKWNCPNLPVVGVCWYEADAFARWLTLESNDNFTYKLPSEIEWQAADCVCDLSGNVWEWTLSDYDSKNELMDFKFETDYKKIKEKPVLRGGSWIFDIQSYDFRCADSFSVDPDSRLLNIGIRCVRT